MGIESALGILLWIVVIFALAWLAHYLITKFLPTEMHTPALMIVGVIFLIVVVMMLVSGSPRLPALR